MNLLIKIKKENIGITLDEFGKPVDKTVFYDEHNLTRRLLLEIDRIIKKNGLNIEDIKKVKVISDKSDSFTTSRIAKAVANTINWAKEQGG